MFSLSQIKEAHAKVKSGKDFPGYIQELKRLGVVSYDHFVAEGKISYTGADEFSIVSEAKYPPIEIAGTSSVEQLKHALAIHQNGKTDYFTFCKQSAAAGVEKWTVGFSKMTCIYYDKTGEVMVLEVIPE